MNWFKRLFVQRNAERIAAPDDARRRSFPIEPPGAVLKLSGVATVVEGTRRNGVIIRVDYFDAAGKRVPGPYPGLRHSKRHGPHLFAATEVDGKPFEVYLPSPDDAASVKLTFRPWKSHGLELSNLEIAAYDLKHALEISKDNSADLVLLRTLARKAVRSGSLSTGATVMRSMYARHGSPSDRRELDRLLGIIRELNPSWTPNIPTSLALAGRPRPRTVCHLFKVTYPYENSGGAIRGRNLVNSLRLVGYESIVVTPLGYPDEAQLERRRVIDGVSYFNLALPGTASPNAPLDRQLQYDALLTAAIIAREAPSIIHAASGYRGYELALKALPIGRRFGLPVIYEVRSFHEHLWGGEGSFESEWTALRVRQEDRCMREAAAVVTISQTMKRALVERGIDAAKIHVVPNAVGDEFLESAPSRAPELRQSLGFAKATVIGYVSNLSRREGHDVLLQAVAALHANRRDVRCLIVGDGPMREELKRLARRLGIADRTVFTGEVDHARVRDYYETIDIFVVPRREDYAADHVTPLKPFEALALKRPLVMSDRPVSAEIAGNQERGLLFKTGNAEHLVAVLDGLIDHPDKSRARVAEGRRWVEAERTWKANAARYVEIYEQLTASNRDWNQSRNRNG